MTPLPDRFVVQVSRLDTRAAPHRWLWAEENRAAIAANWARLQADGLKVYNGRVLLVSAAEHAGDAFRATYFETDYADFIAWRDLGFPDRTVINGFAMGALQGSDGAYVLGVMGPHTANAGRVYFAAGTPDPSDLTPDGQVDLTASVLRELEEETGLAPAGAALGEGWTVVREGPRISFLRPVRYPETAETLAARILAHLEREAEPELAGVRIVRNEGDIDAASMPDFLQVFLRWSFARGGDQM